MPRYEPLNHEELDLAYTIAKHSLLNDHKLHKQVHEMSAVYTRSEQSLYLLTIRMFYVLHGKMPCGITSCDWYKASRPVAQYLLFRGLSISDEYKEHMAKEKPVVSNEDARKLMSEYYKENKTWLPDTIKNKRELVIDCIEHGTSPAEAFKKAITSV
jgi:hypothetical protein